MPPRIVTASIVAFWLFTLGWFAYREWLPWLRADSPPPFTVELVDEAAPLDARWWIWRGDKRLCSLTTRMTVQKDDTFELHSSIENMIVPIPTVGKQSPAEFKVTKLTTVQKVSREGLLRSFHSKLDIEITGLGAEIKAAARMEGVVKEGKLFSHCRLEMPFLPALEQDLEPIPLESGSVFNPLQPLAKLQVWPGQSWKLTSFDPMLEALKATARKYGVNLPLKGPSAFLAQVRSEPVVLTHQDYETHQDREILCYVIDYRSGDMVGHTWAQVADGKVLRQEVDGLGDKLVLIREH